MKCIKNVLFLLLAILIVSFIGSSGRIVYICNNGKTEVYHLNYNCQALGRCTHEIIELPESKAIERGKRVCGYED